MKNKFNNFKGKKYLLLFVLVMMLNTALVVTLIRVSFGQTKKDDFSLQESVKAEVMEQKDCPLQIVVVRVDNSPLSYQDIIFSIQNISDKPVKAYTLLGNGKKDNGKIITSFFVANRFPTGQSVTNNLDIERSVITDGETILLSIDYVEFEDGSSWGNDSAGKSEEIAGQREGIKAAISQIKDTIAKQNLEKSNNIGNLLKRNIQDMVVDVPNSNQSDLWKKGFSLGYKSVISILKRVEEQKIEGVIEKLNEIERIANQGGRQ